MRKWRASRWVACFALFCACTPKDGARAPSTPALAGEGAVALPSAQPAPVSGPVAPPLEADPVLVVTEPRALAELERAGLALGDFLIGRGTGAVSNRRLLDSPRYASVVATLKADVRGLAAGDPAAGVGVARYSHRLFDVRWLEAEALRFELVAAVNRADRAAFRPGSCGETRLVYRLGYRGAGPGEVGSRLPMTLSLEIPITSQPSCRDAVRRWRVPASLSGAELARALTAPGAALEPSFLDQRFSAARLAANVQGVRWPSAVRPDLGGHAEYLLRSFELDASGRYRPGRLENTPDSERFAREPALRADFVKWLREGDNLAAVSRGVAVLPERFLADRALSVTPRGLSRLANRPFSGVLSSAELGELRFSDGSPVRSAASLLRRLDALSCPGCHAARSVAGFHLLGDDAADGTPGNSLSSGLSPHVRDDLARRLAFAKRAGEPGNDDSQPFPERGAYAGYGAHCGLGDPSFAGWTCASGLVCKPYDGPAGDGVGQCVPETAGFAGDACELGPLQAKRNARRDRVARVERSACAGTAVCDTNAVGFPGGMCAESCGNLSPSAACGAIAILDPFNACLARNEPFSICISQHVRPAGLRACGPEAPCRDDYVCARGPTADVCLPPYFLFQLRVDGHR